MSETEESIDVPPRKIVYSMIFARTIDGVIGSHNELPWKNNKDYSWDMERFKKTTTGHYVIMGLNTFKSMKCRRLKDRANIVLTSRADEFNPADYNSSKQAPIVFLKNIEEAHDYIKAHPYNTDDSDPNIESVFVIGGAKIYESYIKYKPTKEYPVYIVRLLESIIYKGFPGDTKMYPIESEPLYKNGFLISVIENHETGQFVDRILCGVIIDKISSMID